jgi:DNA repair exonuclease SbcCD ATPase subunit
MEDPNAPATKGDIADVKAELKGDIAAVKAELKGDIADVKTQMEQFRAETNHMYNDLVERIADSETRLLKAFYNYAESNQQRLAQIDGDQAAIRNRLGSIETRLLEVEKRLNMPPAA